eukprot:6707175-Pyramimonas_sp.AAC.1
MEEGKLLRLQDELLQEEAFIAEQEALSAQLLEQHQHILQELEALKHPGSVPPKEREPGTKQSSNTPHHEDA